MYQALYRKYRPQTFDEVVGQAGVTQTLKAQLQTGRLSHAYLFTGSRGTGKTSCAKILAKAVNCLNPQDGNPCNVCTACRSIDAGSCMDVLEIDAASNNGVDNVRDLRDDAIYTPSEVKRRVYIIDEVHMLSISAFNALLKIIEEPPEHLIFILATTELHKVPATILSRCQRFSFRRIAPEDMATRLQYVASQEQIVLEPQAAMILARMADGALRDGVSLLDQCASATLGPVTAEAVYQCLGLAGEKKAAELMAAIAGKDTRRALELFDRLYAGGKDVSALLDELCALARDLLVLKTAPKAGLAMLSGVSTEEEAVSLRDRLSAGELIQILKTLQQTAAGFTRGGKNRLDGELCLIRLCEPALSLEPEAINARLTRLEEAARQRKITLTLTGACQRVDGAEKLLEEILFNLCDNAIKYNKEGGRVEVSVTREPQWVVLTVQDTGIGIPSGETDRVFERFYRVDKSHSKEIGGTGLGLSIVKHGAALHHAAIHVDSEPGEGTAITLTFPAG